MSSFPGLKVWGNDVPARVRHDGRNAGHRKADALICSCLIFLRNSCSWESVTRSHYLWFWHYLGYPRSLKTSNFLSSFWPKKFLIKFDCQAFHILYQSVLLWTDRLLIISCNQYSFEWVFYL